MIHFNLPLPGIDTYITAPVAKCIVKDLIQWSKLKNLYSINRSTDTEYINSFWNVGENQRELNSATVSLEYTYEEEYDESRLATTRIRNNDRKFILLDENGFSIQPLTIETNLRMNVKFKSKNESDIKRIINDLRFTLITDSQATLHTIFYKYYLPETLDPLIITLTDLKNKALDTSITPIEYLKSITDSRVTLISDVGGTKLQVGFKEIIHGVLGKFVSELTNLKSDYDKQTGYYSLDFEYLITYDKVFSLDVNYRKMFYNQFLPPEFITMVSNHQYKKGNLTEIQQVEEHFSAAPEPVKNILKRLRGRDYIHIPEIDNHKEYSCNLGIPIFSALIQVDKENPNYLFNLKDLGDYYLEPNLIKFLEESEYPYIAKHLESVFQIHLYENDKKISTDDITVDKELNIFRETPMDISKQYRVLFCIINRVPILSSKAQIRLTKYINLLQNRLALLSKFTKDVNIPFSFTSDLPNVTELLNAIQTLENLPTCVYTTIRPIDTEFNPMVNDIFKQYPVLDKYITNTFTEIQYCDNMVKLIGDDTVVILEDRIYIYKEDKTIILFKEYRVEIIDGVYYIYYKGELIAESLTLADLLYNITTYGLNLMEFNLSQDRAIMKTVQTSHIIAYTMRSLNAS